MKNLKKIKVSDLKLHRALMLIITVLLLSGCGGQASQDEVSHANDKLSAPLPKAFRALDANENNLVVEVIINENAPIPCTNLTVDTENSTYSCSITLPAGSHTLSMVYSIIDETYGTVKVAITSSIDLDVVTGEAATAEFSQELITYEDKDSDGVNNLKELNAGTDPDKADYYISGTVSGLSGSGTLLQLNGNNDLTLAADGDFSFSVTMDDESDWTVTVLTQPADPKQTCTIANGNGTISAANVTDVTVTCITEATDTTAPIATCTRPTDGAVDVALNTPVSVTFSEKINLGTIPANSITVTNGDNLVTGTEAWKTDGKRVTFAPKSNLAKGIQYTVKIAGIEDLSGNPLASTTCTFTTISPPPPPVAVSQKITFAKNTSRAITLTGENSEKKTLKYTVVKPPINGTLSGTAPKLFYTPNKDYSGSDSFTFKVNDGALDSAVATVKLVIKTYVLLEERHDNGNGATNYIYTYTYDANGNQLTRSYDTNEDGTAESIITYTYDANGNQLTRSNDSNADGTAESITTFIYNDSNRLTYSSDERGDGAVDNVRTSTYDANGNLLTDSYDIDGDGTKDRIDTNTYDANGNRLTYSRDEDGDNKIDYIRSYTYDDNGRVLSYILDYDGDVDQDRDGIADGIGTNTYDNNGNRLTYNYDKDADGTSDTIWIYTYDDSGNRLTLSEDNDGDGIIDRIETYTYDYNGNRLTLSYDHDGDGTVDDINTYIWAELSEPKK